MLAVCALAPRAQEAPASTSIPDAIETQGPHHDEAAQDSPQRMALLATAENALARGEVSTAATSLEAAALMAHSLDTELLQVRTMMQAGEYRHAAGFAAHTAGGHVEEGATPAALYAWLLFLGGQGEFGKRMLDESLARSPANPLANEVRALMNDDRIAPSPSLLLPPHRLAPYAVMMAGEPPPAAARATGNGVLWNGGAEALVPASALGGAAQCWLRNGRGQTVAASVTRLVKGTGLALLSLAAPLPMNANLLAVREPFAGSQGFVADYPAVNGAAPTWPRVHPGFLGGATASSPVRRLGIVVRAAPRGGPVFNAAGKLAGIALTADAGGDIYLTLPDLRVALGGPAESPTPASPIVPVGLDEGYEHAMQLALQVIVAK